MEEPKVLTLSVALDRAEKLMGKPLTSKQQYLVFLATAVYNSDLLKVYGTRSFAASVTGAS